jgi:hypothetical protein
MTYTDSEKVLINQGLDDAINQITTPAWKRRARLAQEEWQAGTVDPKFLALALAPVPASREGYDKYSRPENYHDHLRALVKRLSA